MRSFVTAVLLAVAVTVTAAPKEHPYLFFSKKDIPAFKEKIKNLEWSGKAFNRLKKSVEKFGEVTLPGPNASIRNEWEPKVARNGRFARDAAFLYVLTGEEQYLTKARTFLLTYAENFDDRINFHNLDDKDGITVYVTGGFGLLCAWTYDMIYDRLTPAQRETVENGLLRATVNMMKETVNRQDSYDAWAGKSESDTAASKRAKDYDWGPGQWNGTLYCNTGITAIGFALQDKDIYQHGIDNWKTYLARDMLNDGMWIEEDFAYSRFCYSSMITVAEMAYQYGYPENLYTVKVKSKPAAEWDASYATLLPYDGKDRGYRTMKMFLDAQLDYQYPNMKPGNWGWQMNRASFLNNDKNVTFYELGYLRYGDPLYGWILNRMDRSRGNGYVQGNISPILYGDPVGEAEPTGTASRVYDHGGWVVLKSVEGAEYWNSDAIYAFTPYAMTRTKGLARLSLDLFAYGKVVAPRVAKITRYQAHDKDYYLHEDSWNNLMVDGMNLSGLQHRLTGSRMRFHEFSPEIKIAQPEIDVEKHIRPSIWYDEVTERRPQDDFTMSRALGMTDSYLLDITAVKFKQPQKIKHNFYWNLHGMGEVTVAGIPVREGMTKGQWSATWKDADSIGLRIVMLGSDADENTAVRQLKDERTSYIKALRGNYREAFIAVHEPFRDSAKMDSVISMDGDSVSCAVKVVDNGVFTDYLCVAFDADRMTAEKGGEKIVLDGYYGYVRNAGGELKCRGNIASFVIKGAPVKKASLNGKKINVMCKGGMIAYSR